MLQRNALQELELGVEEHWCQERSVDDAANLKDVHLLKDGRRLLGSRDDVPHL